MKSEPQKTWDLDIMLCREGDGTVLATPVKVKHVKDFSGPKVTALSRLAKLLVRNPEILPTVNASLRLWEESTRAINAAR